MRTGIGLAFVCVGAILAFAVTTNTSVFNLHTAGWVIMLIGIIGLLIPRQTYGWLGRRMLVQRTHPGNRVEEIPVPPYVAAIPGPHGSGLACRHSRPCSTTPVPTRWRTPRRPAAARRPAAPK